MALSVDVVCNPQRAGQPGRVRLNPADVVVGDVVFRVDRHRERLDSGQVQPVDLAEVPLRIFGAAERRAEREVKHREQRQHDDDRHEARLLKQQNQTERDRRRGEIAQRQPLEMPAPDLNRRLPGVESHGHRGQTRVQREVDDRQTPAAARTRAPIADGVAASGGTPAIQKNA